MRRLLSLAIVLLFAMSCAFALDGIVTWVWYVNDWDVQYYRYQVDGEDDDKWTVVDWDVNEVTLELDVSVVHTLYLQQSYDGEIWSVSSMTDSEIYEESAEEPYYDETMEEIPLDDGFDGSQEEITEEAPAVAGDSVTEAVAEVQTEAEVESEPEKSSFTYLDLGIGYLNAIPNTAGPKMLGASVSYNHPFFSAGAFDIGVKANLGLYSSKNLFFKIKETQLFTYLNALAMASVKIGNCDLYGAIGPELAAHLVTENAFHAGLAAEVGLRYHRFENLFLGFSLSDHYYLLPYDDIENQFDVRLYITRGF